jgi:hypothetical protein
MKQGNMVVRGAACLLVLLALLPADLAVAVEAEACEPGPMPYDGIVGASLAPEEAMPRDASGRTVTISVYSRCAVKAISLFLPVHRPPGHRSDESNR